MNIRSSINTIRKFWNFLEGLYPVLGWFRKKGRSLVVRIVEIPSVQKAVKRLDQSPRASAFKSLSESFLWGDLTKQRTRLQELPPDALAVLRPIFLASMALVLSLPFTWTLIWPLVRPFASEGTQMPIAGWSVLLWGICTAMGWGCLLGGTGAANRTSFAITAIFNQFILAVITAGTGVQGMRASVLVFCRWWIALTALWASAMCQRRLSGKGRLPTLYSLLTCCAVGSFAGIYLWNSLPWAAHLPGQNIELGMAFGLLVGVICHMIARVRPETLPARLFFEPFRRLPRTVHALMLSNGLWLLAAGAALGLPSFAEALLSGHKYLVTHFWPLWYFIGVGIIFKILRNSKAVSQSLRTIIRPGLFVPGIILVFVSGFVVTGSYTALMAHSIQWPEWFTGTTYRIYSWTKEWLWTTPSVWFTMEWMFWVFLFDVVSMVWLAVRRQLVAERLASLFFINVLCFFFAYEYFSQSLGFLRTPRHSMVLYVFFSFWLLWLIQSSTHFVRVKSSRLWPSEARTAAFGSVILFALLDIHTRTAVHDFHAMTEVFWYMFRGMIDVGMPFGLYVYAGRRLNELPLPVSHLFAGFCTGAFLTMPLNFLEHLVMAGGSWARLNQDLSVFIGKAASYLPVTPAWWGIVRAVLVALVLTGTAVVSRRLYRNDRRSSAAVLFSVITVGLGLAAFSNIQISLLLPFIPTKWEWYWQPVYTSLAIEYPLLFLYLSYALPGVIIGLTASAECVSPSRWALGIFAAFLTHVLIAWLWPAWKPLLEASGLAGTIALAGASICAVLADRVRSRAEALSQDVPETQALPTTLANAQELSGESRFRFKLKAMASCLLLLVGLGWYQWQWARTHLVIRTVSLNWLTAPVPTPEGWEQSFSSGPSDPPSAGFTGPAGLYVRPMFLVSAEHDEDSRLASLIVRKEKESPLPGYRRSWLEDWQAYYSGAVAAHYSFELMLNKGSTHPVTAISVFVPLVEKQVLVLTLVDSPENRDARILDMIQIVRRAAEMWPEQAQVLNTRKGSSSSE